MDTNRVGRVLGRLATAVGLAIALTGCGMAVEDPPRAMYGTSAWSNAWQTTCGSVDPGAKPEQLGDQHLNNDCAQYDVAQRLRNNYEPSIAAKEKH
jgi:hypothetical protein